MVTTMVSLKTITMPWKNYLGEKITPAKFTDLNRTGFWIKIPGKVSVVSIMNMLVKSM